MSLSLIQTFFNIATLMMAVYLPLAAFCYGLYYLVSLPLRRQERARILVDLLELQATQHYHPTQAIKELSQTKDPALGVRFHLLAGYLESGHSLAEGLRRVPRLLPETIAGILSVGESLGSLNKVLPACQTHLTDAAATVRNVTNHLLMGLFVALPSLLTLMLFIYQVWPKIQMIGEDYGVRSLPVIQYATALLPKVLVVLSILYGLYYLGALFYVGGPRLRHWIENGIAPVTHAVAMSIPWHRKRLLRNFSIMLGVLLDSGVPESEALTLAATASSNQVLKGRVKRCTQALANGESLETAITRLDATPELSWRLRLAAHQPNGFQAALKGWWECLHTKARQQEQLSAQVFSVGMILLNGLIAATISISTFHLITQIIEQGSLW